MEQPFQNLIVWDGVKLNTHHPNCHADWDKSHNVIIQKEWDWDEKVYINNFFRFQHALQPLKGKNQDCT